MDVLLHGGRRGTLIAALAAAHVAGSLAAPQARADPPGGPRSEEIVVRTSLEVGAPGLDAAWSAKATTSVTVPRARAPEFREVTEAHTALRRTRAFRRVLDELGVARDVGRSNQSSGAGGHVTVTPLPRGVQISHVARAEVFSDTPLEIGGWRITRRGPRLVIVFRPAQDRPDVVLRDLAVTTRSLDAVVPRPVPTAQGAHGRLRWHFDAELPPAVVVSGRIPWRARLASTTLWRYLRPIGAVLATMIVLPFAALALGRMGAASAVPCGSLQRARRALPYLAAPAIAGLASIIVIESTHGGHGPSEAMAIDGAVLALPLLGFLALALVPRGECLLSYRRRAPLRALAVAAAVSFAVLARFTHFWEPPATDLVRDVFAAAAVLTTVALSVIMIIALARVLAGFTPAWLATSRGRHALLRRSAIAVGVLVGAQSVWSTYLDAKRFAPVDEVATFDEFAQDVESSLTVLPLNLVMITLPALAAGVTLAVMSALTVRGREERLLPLRGPAALAVGVLFASLATSTTGTYLGVAFPLGFLLALVLYLGVARWLAARTAERSAEIARLNPGWNGGASVLWRHQRGLFERALDLARLETLEADAYEAYLSSDQSKGSDYLTELAAARTQRDEVAAAGASTRRGVRLPASLRPVEAAFGSGPAGGWRGNGIVAARIGLRLAVVPLAIYAYGVATRAGRQLTGESQFGLLDAVTHGAAELTFWVVASFVLGALFSQLPGRFGLVRGAALGIAFAVPVGIAGVLGDHDTGWTFRALEVIVLLSVLGLMLDRRTLARYGMGRPHLTALYEIRRGRFAAAYASTATLLITAVAQQIAAGRADQALTELLRGAPGLLQL
ncbi:MAG TPA: DUF6185 family protein [Thermoleophilaceae bacterium]|nr:DUF6185 family protein [Thermoleophilaceae bacterium]